MSSEQITKRLLQEAKEEGAEYPTFADTLDGSVVILDTSSGRTWKITLVEF